MAPDEPSRCLWLTAQEAQLGAETLRAEAKAAPPEFLAGQKALFNRFALAVTASLQTAPVQVNLTESDVWVLSLCISYFARIGQDPTGIMLQTKLTQLRVEFEVGEVLEAPEPLRPTRNDVVAQLTRAQPWVKHPRDKQGRFRKRG